MNENSFLVLADDVADALYKVLSLARRYSQETVLYVDANRKAALYHTDWGQKKVELGYFREVSELDAKAQDSYTLSDGRYYITRSY